MLLLTISLVISGIFCGGVINDIATRYPVFLIAGWKQEAIELLGQDFHVHLLPKRSSPEQSNQGKESRMKWKRMKLHILQMITTILFVISGLWVGMGLQLSILVFVAILIILALIDLEHYFLPDQFVGLLLFVGLCVNTQSVFATSLNSALWGVVVGYFMLWLIRAIYKQIRKRNCLGLGDCKFTAAIGAWVGLEMIFSTMAIAAVVSVCYFALRFLLLKNKFATRVAFGPWLALGGLGSLLYGY